MESKVIEFLRTIPENSGQKVQIETWNGMRQFYFMWFRNDNIIDLKPVDNINIFALQKRYWDGLELVF